MNASTSYKSHAGTSGIRICVYKPGKPVWTTIYASKQVLAGMFEVCGEDVGAVTHAARYASLVSAPVAGEAWSRTVLEGARKFLIAAKAKQDRLRRQANAVAAAQLAAENNAVWEQVLADKEGSAS